MEEIGYLMIQIFLLLFMAEVFGRLLKQFKMPDIVGYIIAGVLFVNVTILCPEVGSALHFNITTIESDKGHFINVMGQLGLVFLLFSIGMETKLSELLDIGSKAFIVAVVGIVLPFFCGFASYLVSNNFDNAMMIGTCIFAMSTGVSVQVLRGLDITDTDEGKLIIGIAIFSDIICLTILAINISIVSPAHENAIWMNILIILVFIAMAFLFISRTGNRRKKRQAAMKRHGIEIDPTVFDSFPAAFVICLAFTASSYLVGLSGIVGAFLAGMYFAEYDNITHMRTQFDALTKFLLPFFFIYVGLGLRADYMTMGVVWIAIALIVVAVVSKFVGGYIGCRLCKMDRGLSKFVASCMTARGEISIIVATFAHGAGIFSTDVFAAVILMAVVTQIVAPAMMLRFYKESGIKKNDDLNATE